MGELLAPLSGRAAQLKKSLEDFVETKCIPAEELFESQLGQGANRWKVVPAVMEELKVEARRRGLWNLWLPKEFPQGAGLTNSEYAVLAEVTGRSALAPEACNCSAPDTGNMEVLLRYGTPAQKNRWLDPLLRGEIRSAFLMTEPAVASSDATNVSCTFRRRPASKGGGYVVDGVKWWSSGAMDPRCAVAIVLGKIVEEEEEEEGEGAGGSRSGSGSGGSGGGGGGRPRGRRTQQTMLLVPMDAPGVRIVRALTVFGYDDAPHGHAEVALEGVEVGPDALLLGEGRGFDIAQGRLGPGRVHHCMRVIGLTERALQEAADRAVDPTRGVFGQPVLGKLGVVRQQLARGRAGVEMARLLVLAAAAALDADNDVASSFSSSSSSSSSSGAGAGGTSTKTGGDSRSGLKAPRTLQLVALIKAAVPKACERVIDDCLQIFGGAGVCQDHMLARALVGARTLRLADGPDEVHELVVARFELLAAAKRRSRL